MPRFVLESSLLRAMEYQEEEGWLELEFQDGAVYRYFAVPAQTCQELLQAESHGGFFNRSIRNRFDWIQIRLAGISRDGDSGAADGV